MIPEEIKITSKSLKEIENRIVELELLIANQERTQQRPIPQPFIDGKVEQANRPLQKELEILKQKRQFIIDDRNNWKSRIIWNIGAPIIISITTYILFNALT